jgi:hypothetical protein
MKKMALNACFACYSVTILTVCACVDASTPIASSDVISEPTGTQRVTQLMEAADLDGRSVIDYVRILNPGEKVRGYMIVVGLWEVEGDYCTPWTFEAWGPGGVLLDTETINVDIVDYDAYYPFEFTAETSGEYVIRAIHYSLYTRDLTMEIVPPGWRIKEAAS